MTTKEKAKQILEKIASEIDVELYEADGGNYVAKKIALLCVDELIGSYGEYKGMHDQDFFDYEERYWKEVKQEIEITK